MLAALGPGTPKLAVTSDLEVTFRQFEGIQVPLKAGISWTWHVRALGMFRGDTRPRWFLYCWISPVPYTGPHLLPSEGTPREGVSHRPGYCHDCLTAGVIQVTRSHLSWSQPKLCHEGYGSGPNPTLYGVVGSPGARPSSPPELTADP